MIASINSISVLLCEIKVQWVLMASHSCRSRTNTIDASVSKLFPPGSSKLLFPTHSPRRAFLFQAETDAEMACWLKTFGDAKVHAMKSSRHSDASPEAPDDPQLAKSEDEEWNFISSPPLLIKSNELRKSIVAELPQHLLLENQPPLLYPGLTYHKKNEEMHLCMTDKSLGKHEQLLSFFFLSSVGEAQLIPGCVYITACHVYFHATPLSSNIVRCQNYLTFSN